MVTLPEHDRLALDKKDMLSLPITWRAIERHHLVRGVIV
jgi:hypothetical protein